MLTITSSRDLGTIQYNNRHQRKPTDTKTTPTESPRHPKSLFKNTWRLMLTLNGICWCLLVSLGVWRHLLVSYGVWRCEEGVWGVSHRVSECCLWTRLRFGFLRGNIWVFRPCMVQNCFIGKSPKGKTPHTWHFLNLKIQKPPYTTSLKLIGSLHFFKTLSPSEENYNPQSLWIILYLLNCFLKNIFQYLLLACAWWIIVFVFAFEGTTLSSLWIFFCNLSYSSDFYSLSSGGLCVPLLVHICRFFVLNHKSNRFVNVLAQRTVKKKKICRQLALTVKSPALPCVFNSGRCSDG